MRTPEVRPFRGAGWWPVVEHRAMLLRGYWPTMLLTGIGSPVLYLLGLGVGLGTLVDKGRGIEGVDYVTFVAPALVMASVLQTAAQENTYGVFGGFKWSNTFTAMRLTPMRPSEMVVGFQVSVLIRVLAVVACYVVALMVFGIGSPVGALLLFPIAVVVSLAVGFAVMAWVSTQRNDRGQLSFVERFVIVPLTLFSGTYFPLGTLPAILHPIGWISPLWHASELGRAALYGAPVGPAMLGVHLGFLFLVMLIGGAVSVRNFRRRLEE